MTSPLFRRGVQFMIDTYCDEDGSNRRLKARVGDIETGFASAEGFVKWSEAWSWVCKAVELKYA